VGSDLLFACAGTTKKLFSALTTKRRCDGFRPMTSDLKKGKGHNREVTVFEYQLEQYKVDLKSAREEGDEKMVKEISRYIRNLEAIIKRINELNLT
jgi:hypothetical protein